MLPVLQLGLVLLLLVFQSVSSGSDKHFIVTLVVVQLLAL